MSDNPLAAALDSVRSQLIPLTDALIAQLEAEADPQSAEWFVHVRYNLERAQSEEDLIMIFIEQLGPTAPLANLAGFTPIARLRLDQLLAKAQEVAFAFSADTRTGRTGMIGIHSSKSGDDRPTGDGGLSSIPPSSARCQRPYQSAM